MINTDLEIKIQGVLLFMLHRGDPSLVDILQTMDNKLLHFKENTPRGTVWYEDFNAILGAKNPAIGMSVTRRLFFMNEFKKMENIGRG